MTAPFGPPRAIYLAAQRALLSSGTIRHPASSVHIPYATSLSKIAQKTVQHSHWHTINLFPMINASEQFLDCSDTQYDEAGNETVFNWNYALPGHMMMTMKEAPSAVPFLKINHDTKLLTAKGNSDQSRNGLLQRIPLYAGRQVHLKPRRTPRLHPTTWQLI